MGNVSVEWLAAISTGREYSIDEKKYVGQDTTVFPHQLRPTDGHACEKLSSLLHTHA